MKSQQVSARFTNCFDSKDKSYLNSEGGDSGFSSSCNSTFSSTCNSASEILTESMSESIQSTSNQLMESLDSGVDSCLTDSFNHLSLKQIISNHLNSSKKINLKAKSESSSFSIESYKTANSIHAEKLIEDCQEHWQLYYAQNKEGDTLLHTAIIQGYYEATLSLISMAPHPCLFDLLNDNAQTALHLAVIMNQPKIVRKLVIAGADLSIRNRDGNTALHLACTFGNLECAKALTEPIATLERNPLYKILPIVPSNVEQRNYNGETCLHIAAFKGHVDLVNLLVDLGADLNAQESLAGRTALHLALEHGCLNVVLYLIHECQLHFDAETYSGYTAYQIARYIDEQLARELVNHGATPFEEMMLDEEMNDFQQTTSLSYLGHNATAVA